MKKVLVLGASGHAKVVIDICEAMGEFEILGCLGQESELGQRVLGHEVIGTDAYLDTITDRTSVLLAMGVGGYTDNQLRKKLFIEMKEKGCRFATLIHPSAVVCKGVKVKEGSVVFPGAILNTEAVIGHNSIVATGSSLDHETVVGDHVLVSAGCDVGAGVFIEDGALLAIGSTVISRLRVGKEALVAAGATVTKDVAPGARVFGTPAKAR